MWLEMRSRVDKVQPPYLVPAIIHAGRILDFLKDPTHTDASLSEIAAALSLPRSTCLNILRTLASLGFVSVHPRTKRYRLGWTLFELGQRAADMHGRLDLLRPYLSALATDLGLTCVLGRVVDDKLLIIDKVEGSDELRATTTVGQSHPLTAGAVGRAILAFLSDEELRRYMEAHGLPKFTSRSITDPAAFEQCLAQIRRDKYAISIEEYYVGINAVASPVFEPSGEPTMVVAVLGLSSALQPQRLPEVGHKVRQTAMRMTAALGGIWPAGRPEMKVTETSG